MTRYCGGSMRSHRKTVVWYYILPKTICIYKTMPYSKVVDFEILVNFCVDHFLIWRRFGVQIVGTTGCMSAFVQTNCESVLNFKIYSIIKL